jgi:hypothetical protein
MQVRRRAIQSSGRGEISDSGGWVLRTTRLGEPCLHDFLALAPKMRAQDMGKPAGVAPLQRVRAA